MMSTTKKRLETFIESHFVDELVAIVIIINAIALFAATSIHINDHYGWWLEKIDQCALAFFMVELGVRIYIKRLRFFKGGWNLFDLFIVILAIISQTGYFTVLRALRILRVVRLVRLFPKMTFLIASIKDAIPGIVSISCFISLFYFIFSVVAFNLFRYIGAEYFNTIGHTLMTMFQLLLYDNWSAVVRPVQEKIPYSNLFFIIYIVVMKFTLLNLFIGLIINSMQTAARRENKRAMEMLTSNIEAATELETKIETTLENKVDALMLEIKSLRILLNKSP